MTTNRRDFTGEVHAATFHGDGAAVTNLTRANVAAGTNGYVVFNNDTTGRLAEEARLQVKRGGLGSSVSWDLVAGGTDGVLVGIPASTTGAFGQFTVSKSSIANTIVMRDADGDAYVGNPVITTNLTIAPTGIPTSGTVIVGYCTTVGAATATLLDFDTTFTGTNSLAISGDITLCSTTGTSYGSMHIEDRGYCASAGPAFTPLVPLVRKVTSLDAAVAATDVTIVGGGAGHLGHMHIDVTGQAGLTIKWAGIFNIIQQRNA